MSGPQGAANQRLRLVLQVWPLRERDDPLGRFRSTDRMEHLRGQGHEVRAEELVGKLPFAPVHV